METGFDTIKIRALEHIRQGEAEQAINLLLDFCSMHENQGPLHYQLLTLSARYQQWRKDSSLGLVIREQQQVELSAITNSLIELLRDRDQSRALAPVEMGLMPAQESLMTLVIDRKLEDFSNNERDKLLSAIQSLLSIDGSLKIVQVRAGSVLLTISLPDKDIADQLIYHALKGRLQAFQIRDLRIEEDLSTVVSSGNAVLPAEGIAHSVSVFHPQAGDLPYIVRQQDWHIGNIAMFFADIVGIQDIDGFIRESILLQPGHSAGFQYVIIDGHIQQMLSKVAERLVLEATGQDHPNGDADIFYLRHIVRHRSYEESIHVSVLPLGYDLKDSIRRFKWYLGDAFLKKGPTLMHSAMILCFSVHETKLEKNTFLWLQDYLVAIQQICLDYLGNISVQVVLLFEQASHAPTDRMENFMLALLADQRLQHRPIRIERYMPLSDYVMYEWFERHNARKRGNVELLLRAFALSHLSSDEKKKYFREGKMDMKAFDYLQRLIYEEIEKEQ